MDTRIEVKGSPEVKNDGGAAANAARELHSDPTRKLRILCLHGLTTNGKIMAQHMAMAKWAPLMEDIAELAFMDAPFPTTKQFTLEEKSPGPSFEWYQTSNGFTEVHNLDKSFSHFSDFVTLNGPFDGLLGFSQGGIFLAILMAYNQKGMGPKILNSIKFWIVIGGGRFPAKSIQGAYDEIIKCPSLHVIGDKDFMKPFGVKLATACKDPVVIRHPFGHLIPKPTASQRHIVREFLLKQLESKFPSRNGNDPVKITSLL